jgi:hypothetical protein
MENNFSTRKNWYLKTWCRILSFFGIFLGFSSVVVAQYGAIETVYQVKGNILTNECSIPASEVKIAIGEKYNENEEIYWNNFVRSDQKGDFIVPVYRYNSNDIYLKFHDADSLQGGWLKDTVYVVSFDMKNFERDENVHDWTIEYNYANPLNIVMDYQGISPCRKEDIKPIQTIGLPMDVPDLVPIVNEELPDSLTIESVADNPVNSILPDESFATLNVFPNPSIGIFTVEIISDIESAAMLRVFDDRLRLISDNKINLVIGSNKTEINLQDKATGTYLLEIIMKDIKLSAKLIKSAN